MLQEQKVGRHDQWVGLGQNRRTQVIAGIEVRDNDGWCQGSGRAAGEKGTDVRSTEGSVIDRIFRGYSQNIEVFDFADPSKSTSNLIFHKTDNLQLKRPLFTTYVVSFMSIVMGIQWLLLFCSIPFIYQPVNFVTLFYMN